MEKFKVDFLKKVKNDELFEIMEILNRVKQFGLTTEVVYTALKEMKDNPKFSPLLCLQIAAEDWDI